MNCLTEKQLSMEQIVFLIRESLAEGKSVRFSPKGVSMKPMLRQGKDSVVLSSVPGKLKKYDLPLYQRKDGKYVLHRIVKVGETYSCLGDNQLKEESGLQHSQMIALVTGFYRGEKYHSVREPLYWLYCRLWYQARRLYRFCRRILRWLKRKPVK